MAKTRYFYALFLLNCLMNIINFVPRELVDARFGGALMSIAAASLLSPLFIYAFVRLISRFPNQGVPEILSRHLPRPVARVLILGFASLWVIAGLVTLLSFVDITLRFISPDTSPIMVMVGFLILVCLCSRLESISILFGMEMIFAMTLPLILYSLIKALFNPYFSWDAVLQILTYAGHPPDLKSLSASTYLFSGYINLAVFNRVFHSLKSRHVWLLGVLGLLCLLITFLVPFGFFGTASVERHVYTWFSTADSIRIGSFLIERMLFIFYFAYLTLSLVSCIVHWHVALEMLTSLLPKRRSSRDRRRVWGEALILSLFSAIALYLTRLDQYQVNRLGIWFLESRWLGEMGLLLVLFYCVLKLRRASS